MIVVDTTTPLYARGGDHPFRDPCVELVREIGQGRVNATTTVEVIQEFAHVRARRRPRGEVVSLAEEFAELLSPLLVPDERVLRRGLDLFARHQRLCGFDAVLAACAIANGAAALVSADRGFRPIDGLNHVVPDEGGVASLQRPWSGSGP